MFPELTREEFLLKRSSSHFSRLAEDLSSHIAGSLRKAISVTITDIGSPKIEKMSSQEYFNTFSNDFLYKIGFNDGDENFIAFGITLDFIKRSTYKWVGANTKDVKPSEGLSIIEDSFMEKLFPICRENLLEALEKRNCVDVAVDFIDDRDLGIGKENEILVCNLDFDFGDYEASLYLVGTTDLISGLHVERRGSNNKLFREHLGQEVKQSLIASIGDIQLNPIELKQLHVGQKLPIEWDGEECIVRLAGVEETFTKGSLGQNEKRFKSVKI